MLAWKVPSCSQYARTLSSISGKRGLEGTLAEPEVEALGYVIGCLSVIAAADHRDEPPSSQARGTTLLAAPGSDHSLSAVTGLPAGFYLPGPAGLSSRGSPLMTARTPV